jgi:hypothetical protein
MRGPARPGPVTVWHGQDVCRRCPRHPGTMSCRRRMSGRPRSRRTRADEIEVSDVRVARALSALRHDDHEGVDVVGPAWIQYPPAMYTVPSGADRADLVGGSGLVSVVTCGGDAARGVGRGRACRSRRTRLRWRRTLRGITVRDGCRSHPRASPGHRASGRWSSSGRERRGRRGGPEPSWRTVRAAVPVPTTTSGAPPGAIRAGRGAPSCRFASVVLPRHHDCPQPRRMRRAFPRAVTPWHGAARVEEDGLPAVEGGVEVSGSAA